MPLVIDSERPSGAPAATTAWPTCTASDFANTAGLRSLTPSTLITARSLVAEVPTTVAGAVFPSGNVTVTLERPEPWPDDCGRRDDVVVGEDVAVGVEHDAAADVAAAARPAP